MDLQQLEHQIRELSTAPAWDRDEAKAAVSGFLGALERGAIRAATRAESGWEAVEWVKAGILLAFKVGQNQPFEPFLKAANEHFSGSAPQFYDRDTMALRPISPDENIRVVPGGSAIRAGAFVGSSVVVMPPAYVNIGAYVDEGTMVDSHALVGSCAQVGKNVHLSAGAQLGGVLEPIGLRPVIVEDDATIAGNTGIFEGTLIGESAVIAPGVQLTRATAVYDLVKQQILRASSDNPLEIPARAVVVPGSRPASGDWASDRGLQLYAPMIVKYRDDSTDAATALEAALR